MDPSPPISFIKLDQAEVKLALMEDKILQKIQLLMRQLLNGEINSKHMDFRYLNYKNPFNHRERQIHRVVATDFKKVIIDHLEGEEEKLFLETNRESLQHWFEGLTFPYVKFFIDDLNHHHPTLLDQLDLSILKHA